MLVCSLSTLSFGASFVLIGLLAGALSPAPEVETLSPKLAHLDGHGGAYDTLFLGSSRIFHQLDPAQFDRILRTRSFNLGADDLHPPEDGYVLERALAQRRAPLRYVLLEAASIDFAMDADFRETLRARHWHDATRMRLLLQRYIQGDGPYGKQGWRRRGELLSEFPRLLEHLRLFSARSLGHGNGARQLQGALTGESDTRDVVGDGFAPEPPGPMPAALLPKYRRELAKLRKRPARATFSDPASQDALQRMRRRVAEFGGELILVVPPTMSDRVFMPDPAFGPAPRVLDFSSPEKYAELFDPHFRHDIDHLNPEGAARFTQLVAEALGR